MVSPAVFLDRDGVINEDKGHVHKIEDFEWIKGAKSAIKYINQKKYFVFVITNQSGIAKGYYSENDVLLLHRYMSLELNKEGAHIDDYFYSPSHPDGKTNKYDHLKNLRKPNIGMIEIASKKWKFSKKDSLLIGDKQTDILCGEQYGIDSYLFKQDNLFEFVKKIFTKKNL